MSKQKIGLVGLAVMGENLALNIEEKGFPIAVWNRSPDKVDKFVAANPGKQIVGAHSPAELCAALEKPRRIIMMVKAGQPVDDTIAALRPHLEAGDLLVDGGNEFFTNTERRGKELEAAGLRFVGMGVSGGEEGARKGPSMMPGGQRSAYDDLAPVLTRIAAQVDDGPCVDYMGPGGAGHYVKMVHNGIEYGDMQLIAEAYDVLKTLGGLSNAELADRLYVTRPSVSALLERLERGGFIRREVSPNDRRGIAIWLEQRGREAAENLRDETREYLASLMEEMSPAEVEAFTKSVEKFVASGRSRRAKDLAADGGTPS